MKVKHEVKVLLLIMKIIVCGCVLENTDKKNDFIIQSTEIFESDILGNEYKREIEEKNNNGERILYKRFSLNDEIVYSEERKYNNDIIEISCYDIIFGKYIVVNTKKNDQIVYSKTIFEKDDIPVSESTFEYDEFGNLIKQETINGEEEHITLINYEYDGELIIRKKQKTLSPESKTKIIVENEYEGKDLIRQINIISNEAVSSWVVINNYDGKGRIKSTEEYINDELKSKKEYKNGNIRFKITYKDNKVTDEIKYKYTFDNKKNWIIKKTMHKGKNDRIFELITSERRIISYF